MFRRYGDFFYLRAKGNGMINAGITEGDLLLIRKQSDVTSGDIVIVNINGDEEALKRVVMRDIASILQLENPDTRNKDPYRRKVGTHSYSR